MNELELELILWIAGGLFGILSLSLGVYLRSDAVTKRQLHKDVNGLSKSLGEKMDRNLDKTQEMFMQSQHAIHEVDTRVAKNTEAIRWLKDKN